MYTYENHSIWLLVELKTDSIVSDGYSQLLVSFHVHLAYDLAFLLQHTFSENLQMKAARAT